MGSFSSLTFKPLALAVAVGAAGVEVLVYVAVGAAAVDVLVNVAVRAAAVSVLVGVFVLAGAAGVLVRVAVLGAAVNVFVGVKGTPPTITASGTTNVLEELAFFVPVTRNLKVCTPLVSVGLVHSS